MIIKLVVELSFSNQGQVTLLDAHDLAYELRDVILSHRSKLQSAEHSTVKVAAPILDY